MGSSRTWKVAAGGLVVTGLIAGAFLFAKPAPAGPTVTVYKTPT
jgi:hypothetical protein